MSLPIKQTPILKGKDAEKFLKEVNRDRTPEEKDQDIKNFKRAKKVYDSIGLNVLKSKPLESIGFYTLSDERAKNVSGTSPMKRAEMLVTGRCNFKCPYCRGFDNINADVGDIDFGIARETLGYWIDDKLENIRFSGGEPTLYDRLPDLVKQCKEGGIKRIAISSNGSRDFSVYQELIDAGVNDFSISLDACCASFGDKMAGVGGKWGKVAENIKKLSERTYVTVGIVLTEDNVDDLVDIVTFAHNLGVADIRIISAAQFNKLLNNCINIPQEILNAHPILKYRVDHIAEGINVRGMKDSDCKKCYIAQDDSVVAGNEKGEAFFFPCVIAMREGIAPIGKVGANMKKERLAWVEKFNTYENNTCRENCLDCIVQFNNKVESYQDSKKEIL